MAHHILLLPLRHAYQIFLLSRCWQERSRTRILFINSEHRILRGNELIQEDVCQNLVFSEH